MNKYIALGNLTKDPSLKTTKNDNAVCEFSIAINNKVNNSVFYIDVETWGAVANNCNRFLSKGRKVLIEGRLASSSWRNKEGENRTKIYCNAERVTFLDKTEADQSQKTDSVSKTAEKIIEDEFADIPF
jgi:single-strand DNA-binding protein